MYAAGGRFLGHACSQYVVMPHGVSATRDAKISTQTGETATPCFVPPEGGARDLASVSEPRMLATVGRRLTVARLRPSATCLRRPTTSTATTARRRPARRIAGRQPEAR